MSFSENAVVDPLFCLSQRTVLTLKDNLWSGRAAELHITDQQGALWFRADTRSYHSKEPGGTIEYTNGIAIFTLKKKPWSIHSTWRLYKGASTDEKSLLCDIKMSFRAQCDANVLGSLMSAAGWESVPGAKIKIFLNDGDQLLDYCVTGSFRRKEMVIYKVGESENVQLARISRNNEWAAETKKFGAQTYFLEMEAGADAAFLTALAIVIDENFSCAGTKSANLD